MDNIPKIIDIAVGMQKLMFPINTIIFPTLTQKAIPLIPLLLLTTSIYLPSPGRVWINFQITFRILSEPTN